MPAPSDRTAPNCDVGIVCALQIEIAPFLERADKVHKVRGGEFTFYGVVLGEKKIAIVETGAGMKPAQRGTHALLDGHQPPWIISAGLSGGLAPDIRIGDIVFGSEVAAEHHPTLNIPLQEMDPQSGLHVGRLLTSKQIVRLVSEKQQLHEQTGAIAVDMESYHVANICIDRKTPFTAIRCISDDLTADLPPEIMGIMGPKGTVRAGAIAAALFNRPSCVKDLWGLRERALKAGDQLAKFLVALLK